MDFAARTAASLRRSPAAFARKIARYPRLYAAALLARRRLAAAPTSGDARDLLRFTEEFRWADRTLRAIQSPREIEWLLEILRADPPRTVVEIGTQYGGTLFVWTRVATRDAVIATIDAGISVFGSYAPLALVCRAMALGDQRVETLFAADSHDPRTLDRLREALAGRPVDFLFIDGDHSYEGVKQDFDMYAPLVRPGGIVAFHDTAAVGSPAEPVADYWNDFKRDHETLEIVDEEFPLGVCGIGVYRVPDQTARAGG